MPSIVLFVTDMDCWTIGGLAVFTWRSLTPARIFVTVLSQQRSDQYCKGAFAAALGFFISGSKNRTPGAAQPFHSSSSLPPILCAFNRAALNRAALKSMHTKCFLLILASKVRSALPAVRFCVLLSLPFLSLAIHDPASV
eukprot:scaffold82886_cov25-Tisochrysis_lutea.AAC.1